jgi:putative alpha-1,2-mannosidase
MRLARAVAPLHGPTAGVPRFGVRGWSAALAAIGVALSLASAAGAMGGNADLVALVNPMIGTDGNGHTFPGADVPFGMVQFSPVSVGGGPGG